MAAFISGGVARFASVGLVLACLLVLDPGPGANSASACGCGPITFRIQFKIDPAASWQDLLPTPPETTKPTLPMLITDLGLVPEISFEHGQAWKNAAFSAKEVKILLGGVKEYEFPEKLEDEGRQVLHNARVIARANLLNQKETDRFLTLLVANRHDLAGLPFVQGAACRLDKTAALTSLKEVTRIRTAFTRVEQSVATAGEPARQFWPAYQALLKENAGVTRIAPLMQMLATEPAAMRVQLAGHLSTIDHPDATRALARLAVFSFEEEVRAAAVAALKERPAQDCTEILLYGLRYPWPAIVEHAADAITKLERRDLAIHLRRCLEGPDPRAPAVQEVNGKRVSVVREVVRVNHHKNCLLCHAPGNTPDVKFNLAGQSVEILTGAVPIPGQPLPSQSQGYLAVPDVTVRADVTYLRQDFSLAQKVEGAAPWPEMQRFDFLVRTRQLTAEEVKTHDAWARKQGREVLRPHEPAVRAALRRLTERAVSGEHP